jgi:hypothetical protein
MITQALDDGSVKISVDEVKEALKKRRLFILLEDELGDIVTDFSLLRNMGGRNQQSDIEEVFAMFVDAIDNKKYGVEKDGLCLLLNYTLELVQRIIPGKQIIDKSLEDLLLGK